jgi:hypothetical protein
MLDLPSGGPDGPAPDEDDNRSAGRRVEILGPHLRITGRLELGNYHRVTDLVNSGISWLRVREPQVLLRGGESANLEVGDLWVSLNEMTVLAETEPPHEPRGGHEVFINKTSTALAIVTPGHTLTGCIYAPPEASLEVFLHSPEPAFLPMTDVGVRSMIDREVEAEYAFALVNRRHVIAASLAVEALQSSTSLVDRLG